MLLLEEELRSVRERLSELECRLAALETTGGRPPTLGPRLRRLSTTERRVAELVVAGLTDDEVAERLFLSAKTVEWNLTKTCRKFGVRSRTELAALLRPKAGELPGGGPSHERGRR
jgi:DNA-binding NarL/FixJ family response regulator